MKLRVVELLLVTTLPALFLAADGVPPIGISLATLIGGTLEQHPRAGHANYHAGAAAPQAHKLQRGGDPGRRLTHQSARAP